jgi:DNA-binding NarL/FixJ family response regulator
VTGRRILVVDDHPGFRETARRWLEAEGWTVVGEAPDGASGLALAAALHPDVALVDIGLPDMDGFAVAEEMSAGAAPDVVLVSSRGLDAYAGRIATSVAVGFIAKEDLDADGLEALLASVVR